MYIVVVCLVCLLVGYLVYGRFIEKVILPFRNPTPALTRTDGMDYVPMSKKRIELIQLLNIAGTGPIFGALMGAKWGPIVLIWIVAGTIFGGAVHDYMSGMMSIRNGGKSLTYLIRRYLGDKSRYFILALILAVMVMASATLARSASDLLYAITGIPYQIWVILILIYFVASTVLPINKLIGKIYPVFGVLLILMAVIIFCGLAAGGYGFPPMTLSNLHPAGVEFFPDMFITVACGAISGFHATQAPMASRCLKDESDGRSVFYGAMLIESAIAVIWAIAGMTFFSDTSALAAALAAGGASTVVYDISTGVAGSAGGILAVIGVIICPITSGDTALRSARMMIQDDRGYDSSTATNGLIITAILLIPVLLLCLTEFTVLWNYFSWINQTLACLALWTATVFILSTGKRIGYSLITLLPAIFMTMVVSSFILHSSLGLSLDYWVALTVAAAVTVVSTLAFVRYFIVGKKAFQLHDNPEW